jgi:ABC-type molybdenum transport system ATPase subunit/photorepair protein PhrA
MDLLDIGYLKDKSFLKFQVGEQRLVLFARTMVKNPDFLIFRRTSSWIGYSAQKRARHLIEKIL